MRKNTPETAAKTLAEKLRQVLALQEAILLEQRARLDAARAVEPPTLPQDALSLPEAPLIAPFNPNRLIRDDSIPF